MPPTYNVVPGEGVGLFQLGNSLWEVLEIIRTHKTQYPKVELSWDESAPHRSAVTIHLPGVALYFPPSPLYQTLSLIMLPSIRTSGHTLVYGTQVLASPTQVLTRAIVGKLMGPTFISQGGDKLEYPGIGFELATGNVDTPEQATRDDIIQRVSIAPRSGEELVPKIVKCTVQPNVGVTLELDGMDPLPVLLGETTAQDLLLDLGPPLRKYWKEDERLERMWGGESLPGACFWNYFQHGMDFLISADSIVIKILCHSNIPGTPQFQRYARAPWVLPVSSGSDALNLASPASAFRAHLPSNKASNGYPDRPKAGMPSPSPGPTPVHTPPPAVVSSEANTALSALIEGTTKKNKKKRVGSPASVLVDVSETKAAPAVQEQRISGTGEVSRASESSRDDQVDAMVLDRLVEGGLDGVIGLGSSRLIGFEGVIIEEDEKTGGICSVLVYKGD
ncbi:hypothetical protein IAU60_004125 [Kwoniella sp. DSM 27419]